MNFRKTLGFLFSSNVLVAVLSVLLGVATARILGVEGRGEFYLFVQTVSLGTTFLAFGLQSSFQYFLSKQIMPKSDIIGMIILQLVFSTIILSVALALTKKYLVQWFSIDDDFLYAAFICIVLGISVLFFNSVMMTFSRGVKWTSILAVVSSALQLVLFLVFVLLLPDEIGAISCAIIAFSMAYFIRSVASLSVIRDFKFKIKKKYTSDFKMLYKFGAASFLANISVLLLFKVDIFMIQSELGYHQLGIYSAAVTIAEMVLLFPTVVGTALFAHLPNLDFSARISLVRKTLLGVSVLSALALVVLFISGQMILNILFGKSFSGSIQPLLYLLPGLFFMSLNYCFANYFSGVGMPKITGYMFSFGVLTNVLLNFYLIPKYGIAGAAVASSLAYLQVLLSFLWALKRLENVSIQDLLGISKDEIKFIKRLVMSKWRGLFQ